MITPSIARRTLRCTAVAMLALTAGAATAVAQRSAIMSGTVTDSTGRPIAFARVHVDDGPQFLADINGAYRAELRRGERQISVRRIGFTEVTFKVRIEGDTTVNVMMAATAAQLATQAVVAARNDPLGRTGFYDRAVERDRGLNNGTFVYPEEIEGRRPDRTSRMVTKAPGVRLMQVEGAGFAPVTGANCPMTLYVDGQRVNTPGNDIRGGTGGPRLYPGPESRDRSLRERTTEDLRSISIDALVPPNQVHAMEVYPRGAMAPARYQMMSGTCGIVAIWTKNGMGEDQKPASN